MNILVNLSTLKTGGGQNVGMNFIISLFSNFINLHDYFFIVAKNSAIHKYLIKEGFQNYAVLPNHPIARLIYEIVFARRITLKHKTNIIYTYFGYGLFPKRIPQVIGSADSNLYFPEVEFWLGYKGLTLLKKKIVDKYRIWGLKRASGIIFENKILQERFHELYDKGKIPTIFIKPSININYGTKKLTLPPSIPKKSPKGLFLCGWHLNKNILIIPELAAKLKANGVNFHFILTAPESYSEVRVKFLKLIDTFMVSAEISLIGEVGKEELQSLYAQVDYVFLLSKLESFSNNIIEAWSFKKLLVISDEPWSRSICGSGAYYVKRNDLTDISKKIKYIVENPKVYDDIIKHGVEMVGQYPSIDQKTYQELQFLEYTYENI